MSQKFDFAQNDTGAQFRENLRFRQSFFCRWAIAASKKSAFVGGGRSMIAPTIYTAKRRTSYPDFFCRGKTYFVEPVGWWYLTARGSTVPSAGEIFPCRVMSHPRQRSGAKTFHEPNNRGYALFAHPRLDFLSFVLKVFGILKTFFQKGFKWVWAKPTTFRC